MPVPPKVAAYLTVSGVDSGTRLPDSNPRLLGGGRWVGGKRGYGGGNGNGKKYSKMGVIIKTNPSLPLPSPMTWGK